METLFCVLKLTFVIGGCIVSQRTHSTVPFIVEGGPHSWAEIPQLCYTNRKCVYKVQESNFAWIMSLLCFGMESYLYRSNRGWKWFRSGFQATSLSSQQDCFIHRLCGVSPKHFSTCGPVWYREKNRNNSIWVCVQQGVCPTHPVGCICLETWVGPIVYCGGVYCGGVYCSVLWGHRDVRMLTQLSWFPVLPQWLLNLLQ